MAELTHPSQKRYPPELKARAIRMVFETMEETGERVGVSGRIARSLAVVVAVRCRTEWRTRYERLLDRGRARKEALAILSRALLKVIYHLLRTGATYDPAHLRHATATATSPAV